VRRTLRDVFTDLERDYPHLKESLLSAMGNVETSRLLDTRYLNLDGADQESGFFKETPELVQLIG
jgi:tRNA 2-thiocytidine biosynthesis protein TtcA